MSLADLVLEIARIPAPTFAEEPRLAWLEERLRDAPGRRRRDEAGSLIWEWGEGRPRLVVAAHVDTVFPADTRLEFEQRDERLVGPGIGDNAAAVAVALDAVRELLETGRTLAPGAVAFTVGEEGLGNLRGAHAVCQALAPELFLALEGQGIERVDVDAVGSLRATVTVTGPGGHSWRDRGRASAIHELLRVGAELVARSTREVPVNIGLVSGGRSINAIADRAELLVEARALDEAALAEFEHVLGALSVPEPLGLACEIVGRRPAGRLARDHPFVVAVLAVRSELGLPDRLAEGSTDANAALAAGIPALSLGVACGAGMHTLEEWIEPDTLALGRAQLVALLERLLGAEVAP